MFKLLPFDETVGRLARGPRVGDEITVTAILKVMEDGISSVSVPT